MAAASQRWVPDRAEVIFIDHSPHVGKEMRDMHPLLVCSPRAFNERTSIVIGFPMTRAEFNADNPFAIRCADARGIASYVLAFQPKSFDWRARRAKRHPWGTGHHAWLREALTVLDAICGVSETG